MSVDLKDEGDVAPLTPVISIYSRPDSRDHWIVELAWSEDGGKHWGQGVEIGTAKTLEGARCYLPLRTWLACTWAAPDDEAGRARITREIWKPAASTVERTEGMVYECGRCDDPAEPLDPPQWTPDGGRWKRGLCAAHTRAMLTATPRDA